MSEGSGGGSPAPPNDGKKKPLDIIDHMTEHLSSYDGRYLVIPGNTAPYQPYYPPPYLHHQQFIYQHQIHPHYYNHRGYGGGNETGGCLIENMVGNWSPDLTGTYSPFGGGVPPPPQENDGQSFDHQNNINIQSPNQIGHQMQSPQQLQNIQPKKQRIVAEVKPLRPSYSDVVSKSSAPPPLSPVNKTPTPGPIKQPTNIQQVIKEQQNSNKHKSAKQNSNQNSFQSGKDLKKENIIDELSENRKNKKSSLELNQDILKNQETNTASLNNKNKHSTQANISKKIKKQSGRSDEKLSKTSAKYTSSKTTSSYYTDDIYKKYINMSDDEKCSENTDDDIHQSNDNISSRQTRMHHDNSNQRKHTGAVKVERSINASRASGKSKRSQRASKRKENKLGLLCKKWQEKSSYYLIMLATWLINLLVDVAAMSAALLLQVGEVLCRTLIKDFRCFIQWMKSWWIKVDHPVPPISHHNTGPTPLQQNIQLPTTGEEAMKRLLSCKGKDPYSILGLTNTCTDEDIRRYYRSQALLVHPDKNSQPGAEEAFKILVHAFDLIAEPEKRTAYDRYVSETNQVEQAWSELSDLLTQLHEKMHYAATTIRCNNCGKRHKRTLTERPVYAARYCAQCNIHHSAKEGDMWCEVGRWLFSRRYLACMEGSVYEITEWAKCQGGGLADLVPHSHSVHYRVLLGGVDRNNTQTGEAEFEDLLSSIYGQGGNQPRHNRMNNRRKSKKSK